MIGRVENQMLYNIFPQLAVIVGQYTFEERKYGRCECAEICGWCKCLANLKSI